MSVSAAAAGNSWVLAIGTTVPNVPTQLQLVRQTVGSSTKAARLFARGAAGRLGEGPADGRSYRGSVELCACARAFQWTPVRRVRGTAVATGSCRSGGRRRLVGFDRRRGCRDRAADGTSCFGCAIRPVRARLDARRLERVQARLSPISPRGPNRSPKRARRRCANSCACRRPALAA